MSLIKTRRATAELVVILASHSTIITVPSIKTGWRAGQHVKLRVPGLGFPRSLESHPFSIASGPNGDGLVLICKAAGNWTEKLYDYAANNSKSRLIQGSIEDLTTTNVIL
jgi:ferric-chelate reductase